MMKQYLLTGIAALAIGAGFTACSDHDIEVVGGEQAVVQNYNDAFIRVFGEPAPNHVVHSLTPMNGQLLIRCPIP